MPEVTPEMMADARWEEFKHLTLAKYTDLIAALTEARLERDQALQRIEDRAHFDEAKHRALRESSRQGEAVEEVCSEIRGIMATYREQEEKNGYVSTPGGLEHMGDVWRLLGKWDAALGDNLSTNHATATEERKAKRLQRRMKQIHALCVAITCSDPKMLLQSREMVCSIGELSADDCTDDCVSTVDRCRLCGEEYDAHPLQGDKKCEDFEPQICDCKLTVQPEPCVQCGSADHDHTFCPCNCLFDTNASCPIHSFGSKL